MPVVLAQVTDQPLDADALVALVQSPTSGAVACFFGQIRDLLLTLIPAYQRQGKGHIGIAFGCTGGKHRSVFTTEAMAQALREAGFSPTVIHRNLGSRAADRIEAPQH